MLVNVINAIKSDYCIGKKEAASLVKGSQLNK